MLNRALDDRKREALEWVDEKFEHCLNEEIDAFRAEIREGNAKLRAEMEVGSTALRAEIRQLNASLRAEMEAGIAAVRAEMYQLNASLRAEMEAGVAALRAEMYQLSASFRADMYKSISSMRDDLIRWMFTLWIVELVTITAFLLVLFR